MALYLVLVVGAILFAFPFYWLLLTSFQPQRSVLAFPPHLLPSALEWHNYVAGLNGFPFLRSLKNTLIIIAGVQVGQLISVPTAAYAFARLKFPFRRTLFALLLGTMMLPYYAILIPQYIIFRDLGWLNTYLPLIVPSFFGVGAGFYIFLLRQFYSSIPREYDDAARMDGCGRWGVLWHIILPQSKPALAAIAIFTFIAQWNDYFGPLIYLTSPAKYTLALAFFSWQQPVSGLPPVPPNEIMAMATLIALAPVAIFFVAQRYFLRGFIVSGIQG